MSDEHINVPSILVVRPMERATASAEEDLKTKELSEAQAKKLVEDQWEKKK